MSKRELGRISEAGQRPCFDIRFSTFELVSRIPASSFGFDLQALGATALFKEKGALRRPSVQFRALAG